MKKNKQLKRGEMVQIWDHQAYTKFAKLRHLRIDGHGKVGYLVGIAGETGKKTPDGWTSSSGIIWEVICFGDDPPMKYKVHESWLNIVNKSSDIKKVEDE